MVEMVSPAVDWSFCEPIRSSSPYTISTQHLALLKLACSWLRQINCSVLIVQLFYLYGCLSQ